VSALVGAYGGRMARPPRVLVAGGTYHVIGRAIGNEPLYVDVEDRIRKVTLLSRAVGRFDWSLLGFCLMTTHWHALIRTPQPNLDRGMQWLNGCYAQGFNRRHGRLGHRFFRRYEAILVRREAHLLELWRYLALNPVRAGMCSRPEDWPWSSYAMFVGGELPSYVRDDWLLSYFGHERDRARGRLRAFVEGGLVDESSRFRHGV
jgi:putative transposase